MLTAKHIMTSDITTIRPDTTVQEAIDLLLEKEISGTPVVNDDGELVGIVTEFALLAFAYESEVCNDAVGQHMTKQVITVDQDDPVSKVADLCIVNRIRQLPVMSNGKLVGLISRRDVLRVASQAGEAISHVAPSDMRAAASR